VSRKNSALLTDKDLKLLPAGQLVKDEIIRCRSVKGGARKRQVKYLAKVMREEGPVEEILRFSRRSQRIAAEGAKLQREVERLRDVIINEAIEEQQNTLQAGEVWEPDWQGRRLTPPSLAIRLTRAICAAPSTTSSRRECLIPTGRLFAFSKLPWKKRKSCADPRNQKIFNTLQDFAKRLLTKKCHIVSWRW
jgi:hypothetical protein